MRQRHTTPPGTCDCHGWLPSGGSVLEGLEASLSAALACHAREDGIVALDSIIRQGLLTADELGRVAVLGGDRTLRLLSHADGRVESALESVLRHRFLLLGVGVQTQVWIPDLGRVDLLVGKSLIVEADGFEFHAGTTTFRNDRRRDREAVRQGYRIVRLTWADVIHDWAAVLPTLLDILRTRRHRLPPRSAVPQRAVSDTWRSP